MYRSNNWIHECVEFLGIHGTSSALDNTLVAWVKLFQITEEIVVAFSYDDPGNIADLAEPRVQLMLNGFQSQVCAWKDKYEATSSINSMWILNPS